MYPMPTHLSEHFRKRRVERGLREKDLAKLAGYRNVFCGIRRIKAFEETGRIHSELLVKLAEVLEVEPRTVTQLAYQDWCEWFQTVNQPIGPYLLRRVLFGGGMLKVPEHWRSAQGAQKFASDFAKRHKIEVCLVLSQRIRVWFASDGSLKEVIEEVPT
jgi:transcriptional regulator with XRE-family HTH domain